MLISLLIFFFLGLITFWIGKGNDIIWTKIPFLKFLYKNYILHEFTRNVNLLLKSGLTIYNALEIVLSNMNSQYISSTFLTAYLDIEKGKDLTEVFSKIKDVKEFSLTMSVSKRKGNYKEVFDFLENYYYSSFKTASDKIMKMIEPVLIIFLSVIILSLAFEIYSNVYLGGIKFEMGGTF
jgi:type IV pilus assembly protein PilC